MRDPSLNSSRVHYVHEYVIALGNVCIQIFSPQLWVNSKTDCVLVMENRANPTRDPELVMYGAVSTRSYVPFHNWLLREDIRQSRWRCLYEQYWAGISQ